MLFVNRFSVKLSLVASFALALDGVELTLPEAEGFGSNLKEPHRRARSRYIVQANIAYKE